MDYSLLVGIHDCNAAEQDRNDSFDNDVDNDADEEEDEDSPGSGNAGVPTPPDSPMVVSPPPIFTGELDPTLEHFAIKCSDRKFSANVLSKRQEWLTADFLGINNWPAELNLSVIRLNSWKDCKLFNSYS